MYNVTDPQLHQFNVLIDKGGAGTTSKVSDSLAALEPFVQPAGKVHFDAAVQYNIQNASVYGAMQKLHDQIKQQPAGGKPDNGQQPNQPDGGGDEPPPGIQSYPAAAPINNGTRYPSQVPIHEGVMYAFPGSGKKKLSWAISSGGYPCYAGFNPDAVGPGLSPGYTGGTPWENSPDSEWVYYVMFTADQGRVQDAHIDMLDA